MVLDTNYEVWRFETKRFAVVFCAEPEHDTIERFDLTPAEMSAIYDSIERGDLVWFCAVVYVVDRTTREVFGWNTLGSCLYKTYERFREPGGYFADMVREAIQDARKDIHRSAERFAALAGSLRT